MLNKYSASETSGFDDDIWEIKEEPAMEKNIYLADAKKGLELIAKLIKFKKQEGVRNVKKLDYILDNGFINAFSKVDLKSEIELYRKLLRISERLFERKRMRILKHKTVVGIGGKFSAGKSCFINSILPKPILPENQSPTTSIPTYIVSGNIDEIRAYTYSDNDVLLEEEEAQALTHAFYDRYHLGFSYFVSNLVVSVSGFAYPNMAILDTPGYNKEDSGVKRNITDAEKAFEQLKNVDFVIWLVDIENGTIPGPDVEFLQLLSPENPVLFVFNKCDKGKSANDIDSIISSTKNTLKNSYLPVYDVIAYSSLFPKRYDTNGSLAYFLKEADAYDNQKENIELRLEEIFNQSSRELDALQRQNYEQCDIIGKAIYQSNDPVDIKALVQMYSELLKEIRYSKESAKMFSKLCTEIKFLLSEIEKGQ